MAGYMSLSSPSTAHGSPPPTTFPARRFASPGFSARRGGGGSKDWRCVENCASNSAQSRRRFRPSSPSCNPPQHSR